MEPLQQSQIPIFKKKFIMCDYPADPNSKTKLLMHTNTKTKSSFRKFSFNLSIVLVGFICLIYIFCNVFIFSPSKQVNTVKSNDINEASVENYPCPGSQSFIHASCRVITTIDDECSNVLEEMKARVNGQYDKWHDPHNNGTYLDLIEKDGGIVLKHETGNKKYIDHIGFSMSSVQNGKCKLRGCSESQVTSIADFSTNYCNLFHLYCGSKDRCQHVKHDFMYQENKISPSFGAQSDKKSCFIGN